MWNPDQYSKFANERNRPAFELISRIPVNKFSSIIDLGCGNGIITNELKNKFNPDSIIGIDNSELMLERDKTQFPDIKWIVENIKNLSSKADLIFSNATLQWLDKHEELFNKIIRCAN